MQKIDLHLNRELYDRIDQHKAKFIAKPGLSEEIVRLISKTKNEPAWLLEKRLKALQLFNQTLMPAWGPDLSKLDFNEIIFFVEPNAKETDQWDEVPEEIRKTFDRLGIPEAEKKALGGAGGQYDSQVIYHRLMKELKDQGVIFENMDVAVQKYPDLVKKYFMTSCIPISDHKLIMLHAAVWSGGCLTEDSMVFTPNPGIKSIKDVEEGGEVFALDEKGKIQRAKVLGKTDSGKKEVYRMFVGGRTLEATANHKFLCLEKIKQKVNQHDARWIKVWKPLEQIKIGDLIAITKQLPNYGRKYMLPSEIIYTKNIHHQNKLRLPKETNTGFMWLMGLLVGDGNIYFPSKNMCFINFAIPRKTNLRTETIKMVKRIFNYKMVVSNEASITINSKKLGFWLREIGFYGKAKEKRIPEWVFGLPLKQRFAFLGGLLDSDGWIENNGKIIRFEMANKKLIEDIKLLAISCGLYSNGKIFERTRKGNLFKKENRIIKGGPAYSCRITGNLHQIKTKDKRYKRVLGKNKFTIGKYGAVTGKNFASMVSEELGFAPLKEKELLGLKDTYDIQVEKHHNFIANGIVAHNSFIYVPKGVKVDLPLQAYFRMNEQSGGQFEHTLIIVDEGAELHYIEGCSSPRYSKNSLHAGGVEIFVKERAKVRYTSIENWSKNVYNLNTKRALVEKDGTMVWVSGNMGGNVTMLYPCSILRGEGAKTDNLSIAFAGKGQIQDIGAKAIHAAPNTRSTIRSKSISRDGGISNYRGLVRILPSAKGAVTSVVCDGLILDEHSVSNTIPSLRVENNQVDAAHEAKVGKISEEAIFYLQSRGLSEEAAMKLIVSGFIEPIVKELPLEYAIELNKLIELEMEEIK